MTRSFKKRDAFLSTFKHSPSRDFKTAKIDDHDGFRARSRDTATKYHLTSSWDDIYKSELYNKYGMKQPKWQRDTLIY
jgi:hypothetical protein